jgi:hypothetical protein
MVIQWPSEDIRKLFFEFNEDLARLKENPDIKQEKLLSLLQGAELKKLSFDFAVALNTYKVQLEAYVSQYPPAGYGPRVVYRSMRNKYMKSPLGIEGSILKESRYNRVGVPSQPTLYFSESPETTVKELTINSYSNYQMVTFPSEIILKKVFDTEKIDNKEIGKDLLKYEMAIFSLYLEVVPITWIMSDVLRDQGFEAIRYESVRDHGRYNLAVFPKNFSSGSSIKLVNPEEGQSPAEMNIENLSEFLKQYE